LPLGDAHFNDFLSRVKRLGKNNQYFFMLIKNQPILTLFTPYLRLLGTL